MTSPSFKHDNFSSSEVMRSLEKLTVEKLGPAKPPLTKQAEINYTPSSNLMENVLRLCAGLKTSGMIKEANELETNFLQYKRAQTLYDTHKETGDDLIEQAHPEGSHKLRDLDSPEATVEDILEQHVKILQVMNKGTPKGKLSSASLINKVKLALAGQEDVDNLYNQANVAFQKFKNVYDAIASKLGEEVGSNDAFFNVISNALTKKSAYQMQNMENYLTKSLSGLQSDKEPGFFSSAAEKQTWQNEILPLINIANRYATTFQFLVKNIRQTEADAKTNLVKQQYDPDYVAKKEVPPADALIGKGNSLVDRITALGLTQAGSNPVVKSWIPKQINAIKDVMSRFSRLPASQVQAQRQEFETEMTQLEAQVNRAETQIANLKG